MASKDDKPNSGMLSLIALGVLAFLFLGDRGQDNHNDVQQQPDINVYVEPDITVDPEITVESSEVDVQVEVAPEPVPVADPGTAPREESWFEQTQGLAWKCVTSPALGPGYCLWSLVELATGG